MRSPAKVAFAMFVSVLPAAAASGTVVDPEGNPIAAARACLWAGADTGLCVDTDGRGHYRFPKTSVEGVRVTAEGFLSEIVAAVHQSSPVVLRRAAAILIRVVDARDGTPLDGGTVTITYLSGRTLEGFPFNRAGVKVATLEPGSALVRASLPGYRDSDPVPVTLAAGERTEITIRTVRAD